MYVKRTACGVAKSSHAHKRAVDRRRGSGLFADVARHGRSVDKLVKVLNENALAHYSAILPTSHYAQIVSELQYDSVLRVSSDKIRVVSGLLCLLNRSRRAGLCFKSTGLVKRSEKPMFRSDGGAMQEILVCYGRNTGFGFETSS